MRNIFVMLIVQTIGIIIKGNLKVRYGLLFDTFSRFKIKTTRLEWASKT